MLTIKKIEVQNNVQNVTFKLGLNNFSDSNENEFNEMSTDSVVYENQNSDNYSISLQELINK